MRVSFSVTTPRSTTRTRTTPRVRGAAEDCAASASGLDGKTSARVDYRLFLRRCFPAETDELGVLTSDDREGDAASAAATKDPGESERPDESDVDAADASFSADPEGAIAGVRHIGIAHETLYPTRSGTR